MATLEELEAQYPVQGYSRNRCKMTEVLDALDAADTETLGRFMREAEIGRRTGSQISKILAAKGLQISPNNITRHLRGECSYCKRWWRSDANGRPLPLLPNLPNPGSKK